MASITELRPPTIAIEQKTVNTLVEVTEPEESIVLVTSNIQKYEEFRDLGLEATWEPLNLNEIQGTPDEVAEMKAFHAWLKLGKPAIVEETSLDIDALQPFLNPSYVKEWAKDRTRRKEICRILTTSFPDDQRTATFRVLLAYYDGVKVHIHRGETRGLIAEAPRDTERFGFDDIFIANEEIQRANAAQEKPRTYSEMSQKEKNESSPRKKAVDKYNKKPFPKHQAIYELPEPPAEQIRAMRIKELTHGESVEEERLCEQAIAFAYSMEATKHMTPNKELYVKEAEFKPFHRIRHQEGAVDQYKIDPNSADQGVVILRAIDLKTNMEGSPVRLTIAGKDRPILVQMGPEQTQMALASRVLEFKEMHSQKKHEEIRTLAEKPVSSRTNTRDVVLEKMLGMEVRTTKVPEKQNDFKGIKGFFSSVREKLGIKTKTSTFIEKHEVIHPAENVIATSELAYNRISSIEDRRSRKGARNGIILNTRYGPMSMLGLGGMPPTSGSKDTIVTAAISYMQSWIPRNGVYAGNFELQMQLFKEARDQIKEYGLDKDIEKICIDKLGLAIGCEDPEEIASQVEQYYNEGGRAVRIYTTNPDSRILETAKAIRKKLGEGKKDLLIAVGPVTDTEQAKALKREADVGMFLIGHGGGENCTSLEGGGAANSVALLYEMYLEKELNDCLLFMEGGVGTNYGALLGMCDGFSLNKKGIGGIESTAGLYAVHSEIDKPVLPYHGSASPGTQLVEAYLNDSLAERRLNDAGLLENNEGKPNYLWKDDWVHSIVDKIRVQRELIGRALADQKSNSIFDLRELFSEQKRHNIVRSTPAASAIAASHRGR